MQTDQSKFLREAREEVDSFYKAMLAFDAADPADIFQQLAAMSARASFIRGHIVRRDYGPQMNNFRTKEIDPFIAECERQFKVWSRYLSVVDLDFKLGSKTT